MIAASGAITEMFAEEVGEICDSLNGNGSALLDALYSNQIRRLQRAKVDQLQAYLNEHGYLDPNEPLSHDDIRVRMLAAVLEDIQKNQISIDEVNVALSRLPDLVDVAEQPKTSPS